MAIVEGEEPDREMALDVRVLDVAPGDERTVTIMSTRLGPRIGAELEMKSRNMREGDRKHAAMEMEKRRGGLARGKALVRKRRRVADGD
jgi:hypothetical protein